MFKQMFMALLPKEVSVPPLKYSQEISQKSMEMKQNESMKDKLKDINFPDFSATQTVKIDMNSKGKYREDAR